jgi:hypothetical protein
MAMIQETTMFSRRFALAAALLATAAGFSGCASTPTGASPDVLAVVDATVRQADARRAVQLQLSVPSVPVGGTVGMQLRSASAGYVYVYHVGTDGRTLSMIFPNANDGANYVAAGASLQLPRPGWVLRAKGPAGLGYMVAVVAERPQDLRAIDAAVAGQRIAVDGPYGAVMTQFREVAP